MESVVEDDSRVILRSWSRESGSDVALLRDHAHVFLHLLLIHRGVLQHIPGPLNLGKLF